MGSGTVAINGSPTTNFTTIEALTIDGQGGTDTLAVTTPSGGHAETYTFLVRHLIQERYLPVASGTLTAAVPLTFAHIGAGGTVTFAGSGSGNRPLGIERHCQQ